MQQPTPKSLANGTNGSPPSLTHSTSPTPGITVPATPTTPAEDHICTPLHALYAFDVLAAKLEGRKHVPPPFSNTADKYALFVTWSTLRTNGKKSLRGCIGNFTPQALEAGLADYALVSALEDSRFSPIRASELSCLQCSVSLLTPFTSVDDILAWTPGVHGIHISFRHPRTGRKLSATYLPDVVVEQGWSKEEAILSLIHKAGYSGSVSPGDAVWNSIQLKVYESCKAHADFEEYQAWRKNGALPHHEDEENGKSKPNGVVNGGGGTSSAWK